MAAKYDFKTSPDIQGEKEQPTLYPQIVVSGTKNLKDLAKDIARRSTVHEGTVVGLLCDLESIIANYLADGYNVKLGELGTFSATLTCRKVTDKSEIRAASVHFDNIKFKPTRKFRKEVRSKGKLERAEYGFRTSSTRYSAEERFVRLTNYLKEHSIITCKEYYTRCQRPRSPAAYMFRRIPSSHQVLLHFQHRNQRTQLCRLRRWS